MQSKISFCNRALLRKNVTRFLPLWIAYLALWVILMPLSLYNSHMSYGLSALDFQSHILEMALYGGTAVNAVYAIFTAMALFAFAYGSRSVNTIAALPVRRETLFATNICTGLLVAIVPNVLIALLTLAVSALAGYAMLGAILQWLAIVMLEYVFFFGLACLCACFVGHLLTLPILYGLLNFTAVVLNYLVVHILSIFVYGLSSSSLNAIGLSPLSPAFHLLVRCDIASLTEMQGDMMVTISNYFADWAYLGILAGVGVLLLVVGFLLFRRRHMETAGDVIAVRPLRPVFKYCFTAGCSIVLGMLAAITIFSGTPQPSILGIGACLLAGGFVGYFGAEMLLKKTFHVFGRAWIGFGVFGLCLIVSMSLMEFDAFGYERRIPELSEVQSIEVGNGYYRGSTCAVSDEAHMTDLITLHQRVVAEKDAQERLLKIDESQTATLVLNYTLKDGAYLSRTYSLAYGELDWRDDASLIRQFDAIYNDPYLVEQRYTPNDNLTAQNISSASVAGPAANGDWINVDLTYDQAYTLYTDCILPDIRDGNLGKTSFYDAYMLLPNNVAVAVDAAASTDRKYANSISIYFDKTVTTSDGQRRSYSSYLDISIPQTATRTIAYLQELGIDLISQSDYEQGLYQ